MAKVVNLRQARKTRDKDKRKAHADENAVRFGRSKAQRAVEEADAARARNVLDGHRRDEE